MDSIQSIASQVYKSSKGVIAPTENGRTDDKLGQAIEDFTSTLNRTEDVARSAMMGKADPHSLIEALAASQNAVDTVVAVRDRVVEAYQEIIRMQV